VTHTKGLRREKGEMTFCSGRETYQSELGGEEGENVEAFITNLVLTHFLLNALSIFDALYSPFGSLSAQAVCSAGQSQSPTRKGYKVSQRWREFIGLACVRAFMVGASFPAANSCLLVVAVVVVVVVCCFFFFGGGRDKKGRLRCLWNVPAPTPLLLGMLAAVKDFDNRHQRHRT